MLYTLIYIVLFLCFSSKITLKVISFIFHEHSFTRYWWELPRQFSTGNWGSHVFSLKSCPHTQKK